MFQKSRFSIGIAFLSAFAAIASGFISGCDNSVDFHNTVPTGLVITNDKCYVEPGGAVSLCAEAEDADGDTLFYSWTATYGTMIPASGEGDCILWEAPGTPGTYTVTCTVTDKLDERTTSMDIEVGEEVFVQPGVTELSNTDSYYIVSKAFLVRVLEGSTLRVNKGVRIVFVESNGGLQIEGTLEVLGTENEPVIFRTADCSIDDGVWRGVTFTGPNAEGNLKHLSISSAVESIKVIDGASVVMDTCTVVYGSGLGVKAEGAENLQMNRCKIWENSGGMQIIDSFVRITDSSIRENRSYGINLQATAVDNLDFEINYSTIANNYGDGFLLSGYSNPVINNCAIFFNEPEVGNAYCIKLYAHIADLIIDATGNYWGYTTSGEISSEIYDGEDNMNFDSVVDFSGWLSTSPTNW